MVVMDTADAANHRIGVLRIFILFSVFLEILIQGSPVTPLPTTRHVYHSQARYFPSEMRRRWRLEVLHEKYLDELSGDGPTEVSGSAAATIESSIAVPQLPSTAITVAKASPFPEDVSEVENSELSVDIDTDFAEPTHGILHRSSVEFEGPSSLLNTLLFRPSFSSLTPVISTLPVSTTNVLEGLNSDPIDQWEEFFETSSSKYSRKAISSDTMVVIVTEIRATYIYNTRWSPEVPGTPLASSFGLSVITHTSLSSARTLAGTADPPKSHISGSSTFLYTHHTVSFTSALSRVSTLSTRTAVFTSGTSIVLEFSSFKETNGSDFFGSSFETSTKGDIISDVHGRSFSVSPSQETDILLSTSEGKYHVVPSYDSELFYSRMLSRFHETFSAEETPPGTWALSMTEKESRSHVSSTPKSPIFGYLDTKSIGEQPDFAASSSFQTGSSQEFSGATVSNLFSVYDYFTVVSKRSSTAKSTYSTHPPNGHSYSDATILKSVSGIETDEDAFTDTQNILRSSFLSVSELSSSRSTYYYTQSLSFVLPHVSDLPEAESDYYDLSSYPTLSHFDKGDYEEHGSSDSLRYDGSMPLEFSPGTMEVYIPVSGKPHHSLWTSLYENESSADSISPAGTERDISVLPEMDFTTIYDILLTTHHVQARSLSSDTEPSSFSTDAKHIISFESITVSKSKHFPVSKETPLDTILAGSSHTPSTDEIMTSHRVILKEKTQILDSSKSPPVFCTENISANISSGDKMSHSEEDCVHVFITSPPEVFTSLHLSTLNGSVFMHSTPNSSVFAVDFTPEPQSSLFSRKDALPSSSFEETQNETDFHTSSTREFSSIEPMLPTFIYELSSKLFERGKYNHSDSDFAGTRISPSEGTFAFSQATTLPIDTMTKVSVTHRKELTDSVPLSSVSIILSGQDVSEVHTTASSQFPVIFSDLNHTKTSFSLKELSTDTTKTSIVRVITPILTIFSSSGLESDSSVKYLKSPLYSSPSSDTNLESVTLDSSMVLSTHKFVPTTESLFGTSAIRSLEKPIPKFSTIPETIHSVQSFEILSSPTLKNDTVHSKTSSHIDTITHSDTAEQTISSETLSTMIKPIPSSQILQTTIVTPLYPSMSSPPGVPFSVSSATILSSPSDKSHLSVIGATSHDFLPRTEKSSFEISSIAATVHKIPSVSLDRTIQTLPSETLTLTKHIPHLDSSVTMSSVVESFAFHTIISGVSPVGDTIPMSATRSFLISPSSVTGEMRPSVIDILDTSLKSVHMTKSVSRSQVSPAPGVHSTIRLSSPSPRTEIIQTSLWTLREGTRQSETASSVMYSDLMTGMPTMEEEDSSSTEDTMSLPTRDTFLLKDRNFWILTVLETPFLKELPDNFSHTMEIRLANAYSLAFNRFRVQRDLSRKEDLPVYVLILSVTNNVVQGTVELVYIVERGGVLVPAAEAAAAFNLLRHEQLRQYLGYDTIVKATPYHPLESTIGIVQPTVPVSAIVGGILGSLLLLLCCLWLYCRCCRPVATSRRSSQRSLSSYGKHNRQQIFQEDSHHITGAEDIVKEGTSEGTTESKSQIDTEQPHRPLPQIPLKPTEVSPEHPKHPQNESKVSKDVDSDRHRGMTQRVMHQDSYPLPDIESPRRKRARKPLSPDDAEKAALNADIQGTPGDLFHYVPSSPPPFLKKTTMESRHLIDSAPQNQEVSSPAASRCGTGDSEGSDAALLPVDADRMVEDTRSDTDTDAAETQLHLARMRRRISELLDDAFAVAGGRHIYGSLRSKRIGPTPEPFHRFTSFRSAGKRRARSAAGNYQMTESLSFLDTMNRPQSAEGHHPVDTHGEESSSRVPKSVWSFGSDCHQVSENLSASDSLLQDHHSEDKPTSSQSCRFMLRTSRSQFGPSSSMPMLDTLHEHPASPAAPQTVRNAASELYLAHSSHMNPAVSDEYDEIDVISAVRDGEPVAAIIQAIKDELQKFNSSLPGTNQNESFA